MAELRSKDPSLQMLEEAVDQARRQNPRSEGLVDALTSLASQLWFEPEYSDTLVTEALEVAEEIGYRLGRARALTIRGAALYITVRFKEALPLLLESLPVLVELDDKRAYAYAMVTLSGVTQNVQGYDDAVGYGFKAIEAARESDYKEVEGWAHLRLSSTYQDLGDYDRTLEHARRCAKIFKELHGETGRLQHFVGTARAHTQLGAAMLGLGRLEEALSHTEEALKIYRIATESLGETRALTDMGTIHQRLGNLDEAERYLEEGLAIRRRIGHVSSQTTSLIALGKLHLEREDPDRALGYFEEALSIADEAGLKMRSYQAHEALAQAFEAKGDLQNALSHYRDFQKAKDQLAGEAINLRVHNLQVLAKIEQAEKEAAFERARSEELKEKNDELARLLAELKATQDRLVQSEKMASLGQLTAGIAHEIRNPLNFVNNFSELSAEIVAEMSDVLNRCSNRLPEDQRIEMEESLETLVFNTGKIKEHGARADGIVKSMLQHSRSGKGERSEVDLNNLLEEYLNLAYHGMRARESEFNSELVRDFDPEVGKVECVRSDMGRVFLNVISNAFEAMFEHGIQDRPPVLSVSTKRLENAVEIRISDNGPGIPEDVLAKVFEPFFTTKPTGSGTGLGLSMSYDIVTKGHGGSLSVESSREGGATFVINVPA
jgi:signal transduction histidine kinase